jgi:Photosynthetic reaction centre cytochrome C subunit.
MNKTAVFYGILVTIVILALIVSANINKSTERKARFASFVIEQLSSPDTTNTYGKNLQVIHGIHSKDQLLNVMRGFTEALGVKCEFCHDLQDFPSDAKPQKRVARIMIKMVDNINSNFLNDPQKEKVSCFTCHRGQETPGLTFAR